jgi:hypothetical protein
MRAVMICLLASAWVAGCSGKPQAATVAPVPPAAAPATEVAASWVGKWTGPEGTYLEIATQDGAYSVTISNLDGPRTFAAKPGSASLDFERDGTTERIRATDGPGTGMKWLATKTDCLVVSTGEGFCRD